jgi:hypothetical protein
MGIDDPADRAECFSMVGHGFESEMIRTLTKDRQVTTVLHQSRRILLPQLAASMSKYMSKETRGGLMNEARAMFPPKGPMTNCQKFTKAYGNQIATTPDASRGTLVLPPATTALKGEHTGDFSPELLTAFEWIYRILRHTSYRWILAKPKSVVSKAFIVQCVYQGLLLSKRKKMFENDLVWELRERISNVMVKIGKKFGHEIESFSFWDRIKAAPRTSDIITKAAIMPVSNQAETLASASARALAAPDVATKNRQILGQITKLAMTENLGSFQSNGHLKVHPRVKDAMIEFLEASPSLVRYHTRMLNVERNRYWEAWASYRPSG